MSGSFSHTQRREPRTRAVHECPLCGNLGVLHYDLLRDRSFGVPGSWGARLCKNHECGLLWLDPAPIDEDLPDIYANYYTHEDPRPIPTTAVHKIFALVRRGYLTRRFGYVPGPHPTLERTLAPLIHLFPGRREQVHHLVMHLAARPGGMILDVGCGRGHTVAALRELGWLAHGVDMDEAAVERARLAGLDVRKGTLHSSRYPDGAFDAVTLSHVIEHVSDTVELLREARRVVAPSGTLVVVTPNHKSLGHRLFTDRWRGLEPPRHLQVFSRSSLARAATAAGWTHFQIWSNARLARMIWRESRTRGDPPITGGRIGGDLGAVLFQLLERMSILVHPDLGEELVLLARRFDGADS